MKILALLTDAFGGYGGIAVANRHFLRALCQWPKCERVVALPRLMPHEAEPMPSNLDYHKEGLGGKASYFKALVHLLWKGSDYNAIWCGHINLVPLALFARYLTGVPVVLHIHGIDAWNPTGSGLNNLLVGKLDYFISVSETTRERFTEWSGLKGEQGFVLPNTIDFSKFSPGPKEPELMARYGLKKSDYVVMTLGRIVGKERRKGFDRVLESLPKVLSQRPETRYLIAGKGPDEVRLRRKSEELGLADKVIFTGFIPEDEKASHYRIADLFAMPSEGEGFGLVLLEAMACGIPVLGSSRDGTRQALANGELGTLIDPRDLDALAKAIIAPKMVEDIAAKAEKRFGIDRFREGVSTIFEEMELK